MRCSRPRLGRRRSRAFSSIHDEPLVSSDIINNPHSSIFASRQTMTTPKGKGQLLKLVSWYDNEWGFSQRVLRSGHPPCRARVGLRSHNRSSLPRPRTTGKLFADSPVRPIE